MGFRGFLIIGAVVLACVSCTSPGKGYGYLDVLIQPAAFSTPVQPMTTQAFVITFPVRNTYNQDLTVAYYIYQNTGFNHANPSDPLNPIVPNSGSIVQSSSVLIPAFGTVNVTLNVLAQPADVYAWSIVLDPANLIAERNETNNTGTVIVTSADFDVSFDPLTVPQISVPASGDLTVTFGITNTNNIAIAVPTSASVNVTITLDGVTPVMPTSVSAGSPLVLGSLPIIVAAGATVPVSINIPRTTGSHTYTILLTPTVYDSNVSNNTTLVAAPFAN